MKCLSIILSCLPVFLRLYLDCKDIETLTYSYESPTTIEKQRIVSLKGKWIKDSLNLSSVMMPSFCYQIKAGAVFKFTEADSLNVYPKDTSKPCDNFLYSVHDGIIQLTKEDIVMIGEYKLLAENKLMVTSSTFFRWRDDKDSLSHKLFLKEGATTFLTKM